MHLSHVEFQFSTQDINSLLTEVAPDLKARVVDIVEEGIRGQLRFLFWNIDFIAHPSCDAKTNCLLLDISAKKLVPIPGVVVNRQLQDAMRDAPSGVEVVRQSLKLHLPSILQPLGVGVDVKEIHMSDGMLRVVVENCKIPIPPSFVKQSP